MSLNYDKHVFYYDTYINLYKYIRYRVNPSLNAYPHLFVSMVSIDTVEVCRIHMLTSTGWSSSMLQNDNLEIIDGIFNYP